MAEPCQNKSPARARVRCAVYTRKSSEEGLEQEFNSLDAQREACEAYITSPTLATLYDDGAYSGGTMDRPALQRLLLWRRVQGHLEENRLERREGDKALEPSPLTGILFDASSEPMTPTHAVKKGTRYRYYVSRRLITGPATDSSRGQRVPASNLEALVIGRLRALFADPVQVLNAVADGGYDAPMQKRLRDACTPRP